MVLTKVRDDLNFSLLGTGFRLSQAQDHAEASGVAIGNDCSRVIATSPLASVEKALPILPNLKKLITLDEDREVAMPELRCYLESNYRATLSYTYVHPSTIQATSHYNS